MNPRTILLIITFIILVTFGVVLSNYLKPNKVPNQKPSTTSSAIPDSNLNITKDSKTYKNSQFGFSLTIPGNWGYQEYPTRKDLKDDRDNALKIKDLSLTEVALGEIYEEGPAGPTKPYLFHPYSFQIYQGPELQNMSLEDFSQTSEYGKYVKEQHMKWEPVKYSGLNGIQGEYGCMSGCTVTLLRRNPTTIYLVYGENKSIQETDEFLKTLTID